MLKIDILDDNAAREALRKLGDGLPVALSAGLNRTMAAIEQAELNGMERSIDRPTPYTLNALRTWRAHPRHLDGGISVLPDQAKYLQYAIEGGVVESTIVPFKIRRTEHGNIPGKRRGWAGMARGKGVFVGKVKGGRASGKTALWKRQGQSVFLLALRDRNARWAKRWPYYEIAERTAADRLERDLVAAIDRAAR